MTFTFFNRTRTLKVTARTPASSKVSRPVSPVKPTRRTASVEAAKTREAPPEKRHRSPSPARKPSSDKSCPERGRDRSKRDVSKPVKPVDKSKRSRSPVRRRDEREDVSVYGDDSDGDAQPDGKTGKRLCTIILFN